MSFSAKWNYLQMFEDHIQDRKMTSAWSSDHKKVVQQIREKWKLQDQVDEDEIFRVEGIIDINTLELLEPEFEHSVVSTPRAFYPLTSFCSHNCINNTFRTLNRDGKTLQTRAKMDIAQGEEITLHYAGGLKGRILRRTLLAEGWFFACRCKR